MPDRVLDASVHMIDDRAGQDDLPADGAAVMPSQWLAPAPITPAVDPDHYVDTSTTTSRTVVVTFPSAYELGQERPERTGTAIPFSSTVSADDTIPTTATMSTPEPPDAA